MESSSIDGKVLVVTLPCGEVWEIPAEVVAKSRAAYYAQHDTGQTSGEEYDKVFAAEIEVATSDTYEIVDWAGNNMNWSDVAPFATLRKPEPRDVNYQREWRESTMKVE